MLAALGKAVGPGTPDSMPDKITYGSYELVCFHEARHAETAIQLGSRVEKITIFDNADGPNGKCTIEGFPLHRPHICLGGFAAELSPFQAQRLLNRDGSPVDERQFVQALMRNATEDRRRFIALQFGLHLSPDDEISGELDRKFMAFAQGRAENNMSPAAVERIAAAFKGRRELSGAEVHAAYQG
ncbi:MULTISPECIES: hypothetical protein [Methylobacterium]|uniref:hypothetical protein n=1 Tax=Methylobacterium TaxID=407 RepID=UPI001114A41F|nr:MULTISPECIES: hypothetical protein [Methylobacterium]